MYTTITASREAIDNAHRWQAEARRGDDEAPAVTAAQVRARLPHATERVMAEGGLYDPELAALALQQASGDILEAVHLLRAFRATLPRFATSVAIDTDRMCPRRRISAVQKEPAGGQILGPTNDYSHRLLDTDASNAPSGEPPEAEPVALAGRVSDQLHADGLLEAPEHQAEDPEPPDLTQQALRLPAGRAMRLQALARGDEGFLLGLAYSSQRGTADTRPHLAELRVGDATVEIVPAELGFAVDIGDMTVSECETVHRACGGGDAPPRFTRGYGLAFGRCERKALVVALVDRALRAEALGEDATAPACRQDFALENCDSVPASGFLEHLKLPHYVDFHSAALTLRDLQRRAHATPVAEDQPA
ncbi:MAG: carbon-phosphorus lyase complex subunit PhnI [Halofilum sp. (in: g-proteobacteria)]